MDTKSVSTSVDKPRLPTPKPGDRFGRLTVLGPAGFIERPKKKRGGYVWKEPVYLCRCDCGNTCTVAHYHLAQGQTKSCGCLVDEHTKSLTKHGDKRSRYRSRLYVIWSGIIERCRNPKSPNWKNYGARGITICPEWEESYQSFKDWALTHGYKDGLTIDRIDNDGDYSPDNCRWVTPAEQARNRRTNRPITIGGETLLASDWARRIGAASSGIINQRLARGWSLEAACTTPSRPKETPVTINGTTRNIRGWAREIGIDDAAIHFWAKNHGKTLEEAVRHFLNDYEKPSARVIKADGEAHTIREWAEKSGLSISIIRDRLRSGWPEDEAVTTPSQKGRKRGMRLYELDGITDTLSGWARRLGINPATLQNRIHRGWDFMEAATTPVGDSRHSKPLTQSPASTSGCAEKEKNNG